MIKFRKNKVLSTIKRTDDYKNLSKNDKVKQNK